MSIDYALKTYPIDLKFCINVEYAKSRIKFMIKIVWKYKKIVVVVISIIISNSLTRAKQGCPVTRLDYDYNL